MFLAERPEPTGAYDFEGADARRCRPCAALRDCRQLSRCAAGVAARTFQPPWHTGALKTGEFCWLGPAPPSCVPPYRWCWAARFPTRELLRRLMSALGQKLT